MYCKDCKFYDSGECNRIGSEFDERRDVKVQEGTASVFAYTSDDQGIDYGFLVSHKFGCILFQQKVPK